MGDDKRPAGPGADGDPGGVMVDPFESALRWHFSIFGDAIYQATKHQPVSWHHRSVRCGPSHIAAMSYPGVTE